MADHLVRAAKIRHDATVAKAEAGLRELSMRGLPISFAAVARQAGVSTDFLYRHPTLRARIVDLRGRLRPADQIEVPDSGSASAAVRALSGRLKDLERQHRLQMAHLERDLAAAHGENLLLRRLLAAHEDVVP